MSALLKRYTILLLLFLIGSCGRQPAGKEDAVVAQVDGLDITARDFIYNYEFGFAHLKRGNTPAERKNSYLQWMINEKVLAAEGYRRGLDKSAYVRDKERLLSDELLIEALLEQKVKSRITVDDREIREAVNKSKVKFKFRYWPAASREEAQALFAEMSRKGFGEVIALMIQNNPEIDLKMDDFTSDYLTWLEVPEPVMEAIRDLPQGGISQPVKLQNAYFIFQLLDFRREAVTENEYLAQSPTFKKILFQRKYRKAVTQYVDSLMTPLSVATKTAGLRLIADALTEWKTNCDVQSRPFAGCVYEASETNKALYRLRQNLNEVLSAFKGGQVTIARFLGEMPAIRFYEIISGREDIRNALNTGIALYIRDRFMVAEAKESGYDRLPSIDQELKDWRDKWVYEEMITQLAETMQQEDTETPAGLVKSVITAFIDSLKNNHDITIHADVLDTIRVNETTKSRHINMLMYKGGTNRPVIPVADPRWGIFN